MIEKIARKLREQLHHAKKIHEEKNETNKSELQYYKEQVETLKRLAAEKEALLIQKKLIWPISTL